MSKQAQTIDALSIALKCDEKAAELKESLPTIAATFAEAAAMLRTQHEALTRSTCHHLMTFVVTQELIDSGRDGRAPGKYCMTCGELIPKPEKKKPEPAPEQPPQPDSSGAQP